MWTPTARLIALYYLSHARSGWQMGPNACVAGNGSASGPGPVRGAPVVSFRFGIRPGRAFWKNSRRSLRRGAVLRVVDWNVLVDGGQPVLRVTAPKDRPEDIGSIARAFSAK